MHVCPHFGNTMLADVIIVKQNKFLKMEQKFTPNKWQFSHREIPNDPDGMYATQVYTEDGETIATLAWYPMPQRKEIIDGEPKLVTGTYREGNARLIASAPELLKACQNALKDVQKLNKQLIEEGKHGYVLMENELNEAIKLALGS